MTKEWENEQKLRYKRYKGQTSNVSLQHIPTSNEKIKKKGPNNEVNNQLKDQRITHVLNNFEKFSPNRQQHKSISTRSGHSRKFTYKKYSTIFLLNDCSDSYDYFHFHYYTD